jgi:hypothetical protein
MTKAMITAVSAAVVVLVVAIGGFCVFSEVQTNRYENTEYSSEHAINKILDIEELHMASYPYNGKTERVVQKELKNGKTKDKCLYHVTYKGHVQLGTTEKLMASVDEENKSITVTIPDPKILDLSVDFDSIDYIFLKDKYETETVSEDSYQLCLNDMRENLEMDTSMMKKAKKNTENLVLALLKPFSKEYSIQTN